MSSPDPSKSQPLKWSKDHSSSHHRGRRPTESPPPPPSETRPGSRPSPLLNSVRRLDSVNWQSSMESGCGSKRREKMAAERSRTRLVVSCRDQETERPPATVGRDQACPKIRIRLPKPNSVVVPPKPKFADFVVPEEPKRVSDEGKKVQEAMEFDAMEGKTWNLRPRKPLHKKSNGGTSKTGGAGGVAPPQETKSQQEKNFSVSLANQEIADDISSLTGAKPNRRPPKRARNVQKQLDNLFPGLWLVDVTPDLYRDPESPKAKTLK